MLVCPILIPDALLNASMIGPDTMGNLGAEICVVPSSARSQFVQRLFRSFLGVTKANSVRPHKTMCNWDAASAGIGGAENGLSMSSCAVVLVKQDSLASSNTCICCAGARKHFSLPPTVLRDAKTPHVPHLCWSAKDQQRPIRIIPRIRWAQEPQQISLKFCLAPHFVTAPAQDLWLLAAPCRCGWRSRRCTTDHHCVGNRVQRASWTLEHRGGARNFAHTLLSAENARDVTEIKPP